MEQSSRSSHATHPALSIYSPAAPPIVLWSINEEIGETLETCGAGRDVETIAQALPDSVNAIGKMPDRAAHLPIVTTIDFSPAVKGTGPAWHAYERPHEELKFVASLYEVGIGVMVFDENIRTPNDLIGKTIALPRRPSSLRVMAEALLRDGWNILDKVEVLDDLGPRDIAAAIAEGRVDATTWNMMVETPDGMRPLLPGAMKAGRWLSVDETHIDQINAKNDFTTAAVVIDVESASSESETLENATLLSFRQALAAWSATDDKQVEAILQCLETAHGARAESAVVMNDWPGLAETTVHPAALEFYRRSNPDFLKNAEY